MMNERTREQTTNYFQELTRSLRREGFAAGREADGVLPVKLEGRQFCSIMGSGGVRYREDDITGEPMVKALERVTDIARITDEYMRQLEAAPFLRVGSDEDRYRLLAEFHGTVLAGCQTKYGVQFVTWERGPDQTSLNHGHYYGPDCGAEGYTAAKRDFATRSGLIPANALFTQEQMVGISYCVQNVLDGNDTFTAEQDALLQTVREKILGAVPDLDEQLSAFDAQQVKYDMKQSW